MGSRTVIHNNTLLGHFLIYRGHYPTLPSVWLATQTTSQHFLLFQGGRALGSEEKELGWGKKEHGT